MPQTTFDWLMLALAFVCVAAGCLWVEYHRDD